MPLPVPIPDLQNHPHRALAQLLGVLPLCRHDVAAASPARGRGGRLNSWLSIVPQVDVIQTLAGRVSLSRGADGIKAAHHDCSTLARRPLLVVLASVFVLTWSGAGPATVAASAASLSRGHMPACAFLNQTCPVKRASCKVLGCVSENREKQPPAGPTVCTVCEALWRTRVIMLCDFHERTRV